MWMDLIADAIDTAPGHLKQHLHAMASLDNVPRKEKPFRNFTANSLSLRGKSGETTVSAIWSYLCEQRENQKQNKQQSAAASKEEHSAANSQQAATPNVVASPAGSLTKNHAVGGAKCETAISKQTVKKAMKKALKKAAERSLTVKALRRVVRTNTEYDKKRLNELMTHCLTSYDNFVVDGKRITLKKD